MGLVMCSFVKLRPLTDEERGLLQLLQGFQQRLEDGQDLDDQETQVYMEKLHVWRKVQGFIFYERERKELYVRL